MWKMDVWELWIDTNYEAFSVVQVSDGDGTDQGDGSNAGKINRTETEFFCSLFIDLVID